jgi:hypothetical protein
MTKRGAAFKSDACVAFTYTTANQGAKAMPDNLPRNPPGKRLADSFASFDVDGGRSHINDAHRRTQRAPVGSPVLISHNASLQYSRIRFVSLQGSITSLQLPVSPPREHLGSPVRTTSRSKPLPRMKIVRKREGRGAEYLKCAVRHLNLGRAHEKEIGLLRGHLKC